MQLADVQREVEKLRKLVGALRVELEIERRRSGGYRQENERLRLRVADLEMRVRSDSTTSSKPPSSDPPWKDRNARPSPGKRRRGGQKGHRGHRRQMLAPEQVDETQRHRPRYCSGCSATLETAEREQLLERFQWTELPELRARVIEHRCYRVCCDKCGKWTSTRRPQSGKGAGFGPRLSALVSYWTGSCRMSKEQVQRALREVFGVEISRGAIRQCERRMQQALAPVLEHAQQELRRSSVMHMDETGWKTGGQSGYLWVMGHGPLSVFRIEPHRESQVARQMLGSFSGLLITDRYSGYQFWDMRKRQICWAHVQRELRAIVEFAPKGKRIAKRLLAQLKTMFRQWARVRDGTAPVNRRVLMAPITQRIEHWLERGQRSKSRRLRTLCRGLLKMRAALWTFVRIPGAEPTNNRAERDLRHAVLWRRSSHGTQSEGGNRFVESMLSVRASLRAQNRNLLDFLVRSLDAHLWHRPKPFLAP